MKIPQHLQKDHATGAIEGQAVAQFEIGNYKNFVYLALDWATKKAAIIDPQRDLSLPLGVIKKHGFELTAIFLTHSHFDHTAGVGELIRLYPQIPVMIHQDELHRLDKSIVNHGQIKTIHDGDSFAIGALRLQTLHTPGHSAGECCFLMEGAPPDLYLFTGDTLFIRDCGRTDIESGSNEQMFHSLQRLKKLPSNAIVLPGHHYRSECTSTLEVEFRESPPFQCKSVTELANLP